MALRASHGRAAGMSVVELLVALALFAIAAVAALAHYQAARRALALGEGLAEVQQSLRASYDRLGGELWSAGLAVDPDGESAGPDEPIEGAFARAIVVRADFDGGTPAAQLPEALLSQGGPFENVATGNDEIVAYVLAKPDGSSPDTLVFDADVEGVPRDGGVERVSIGAVSLTGDDPPFTLYRVSVKPDSTATLRAPLADNVHAIRFAYFDAAGRQLEPPGGADEADAARVRAEIRRIRVEIEGVVAQADPRWLDPLDPEPATRRRRKFRLSGEIAPPNLGPNGRP